MHSTYASRKIEPERIAESMLRTEITTLKSARITLRNARIERLFR